jgi:branched-chain amino acid transport system substrate-binding protein
VSEYVKNTLGKTRVAILYNSNQTWSVGVKEEFKKRFLELGGQITTEESALSDSHDLRSQLLKIKDSNPDLIYAPTLVDTGIVILKQVKELGLTVPVLGGDVWDDARIAKEAGTAADGMHFTVTAYKPLPQAFLDGMKAMVGTDEMNTYAPRAYDAMYIFIDMMKKVGVDSEKVKNALYQLKDYKGIADNYTLDQNGDVSQATFAIKEFRNGQIVAAQ